MISKKYSCFLILFIALSSLVSAQSLDGFKYNEQDFYKPVITNFQFNGYTNHWQNNYRKLFRTGNLFKMSVDDVEKEILQSKIDIAQDMEIPGLIMQEGFFWNLNSGSYEVLEFPEKDKLLLSLKKGNVLVYISPESQLGKELSATFSGQADEYNTLKSYQYSAIGLKRIDAFILQNEERKIFVVSSPDINSLDKFKELLDNTENIIQKYDFHKGWFGVETWSKSVTCTKGHPLEVIGTGMNEGNSWFVFSGLMDFTSKDELSNWIKQVKLPVVTDVGYSSVFGCKNYDEFQAQHEKRRTKEFWIDYAKEKDGYVFRSPWDTLADPYKYDGYFATEGNKFQIDNEDVPFVLKTGRLDQNATSGMVLFIEKGEQLTNNTMWQAILDRREVGILKKGKMMGPAKFRNALQMLLLDRKFLDEYFGTQINIITNTEGYNLQVTITNSSKEPVSGRLELTLPKALKVKGKSTVSITILAEGIITQNFIMKPDGGAMNYTNPIAIKYRWNGKEKSTLAMLDLPPAISVHQLLYGHAPKINYPVTVHNFTDKSSFPVNVQVFDKKNKVVFEANKTCNAKTASFEDMQFELELPAGNYNVKVSALGVETISQLGVGKAEGAPYVYEIDINGDGINEYRMENDSVQITLLATGARVIEYIVKSRNDNVLFKHWPKKTIDNKRPFRERAYYPYGGFEDFLGQGSMENHEVYKAEILKSEGDYVRVRMWTEYFGNRLEKIYTLYGDSPLLEVRFSLTFKNPEANVLGPQPILALGKKHWTEDLFVIPELDGLKEYRMITDDAFGHLSFIKEGWNAGYDTEQDITFVGAFPVGQPLFLHTWMNHPKNKDTHFYYAEFQPWIPIFQKSTMYFTYYLYGAGGPWENGVQWLRERNLITVR